MGLNRAALVSMAGAIVLAGCASGPADFVHLADSLAPEKGAPQIRTAQQQQRLASSLQAQQRNSASQSETEPSVTSLMALTVIRQQQSEEARALLVESGAAPAKPEDCLATPSSACPSVPPATNQ